MNKNDAFLGSQVADAAALGLHWLYDHQQLALIEATGSVLFRQPDATMFDGQKGYFAHGARRAGQLSHYGESARVAAFACTDGAYTNNAHRQAFLASFGPCGAFHGYADRPTKALVAKILVEGDDLAHPSGIDDDQMPGLCPVGALFAQGLSQEVVLDAVQVISTNAAVRESASIVYQVLELIAGGTPLIDALEHSAQGDSALAKLLQEALAIDNYEPLQAATRFGLACHVPQGMPVAWHLLKHASSFEAVIRDNVRCGGDSCGRAMIVGAIAGLAFGVPITLQQKMQ